MSRSTRPARAGQLPAHRFALYLRQGEATSGPYPRGLLERYVELGRIRAGDELSHDGVHWQPVERLLPGVSALEAPPPDDAGWGLERRRARLRWIEERDGSDRRRRDEVVQRTPARAGRDRRSGPTATVAPRPPEPATQTPWRRWNSAFLVLGVVAGVVLIALLLSTLAPGLVIRIPATPL